MKSYSFEIEDIENELWRSARSNYRDGRERKISKH
jgi:hypothetical protein